MKIFVLEDNVIHQQRMREILSDYTNNFFMTSRPHELLDEINEFGNHQLYFLDIHVKNHEKCGLELARAIREKDPYGVIVFTTSHSDFAILTYEYKVSAFDFIDKNLSKADFEKKVADCIEYVKNYQEKEIDQDQVVIKNQYVNFKIPFKNILYFETTDSHRVQVVLLEKTMEFFGHLSEIEGLDDRLFRCHKSYIVNLMNIMRIDKKEKKALFINDDCFCLVSKRKFKLLQEKLEEYR